MKVNSKAMQTLSRAVHKTAFKFKKNSPKLLLAAGIIGGGVSTVMACKSTLKVNEVIDEHNENIEKIHGVMDGTITVKEGTVYTEQDYKTDLAKQYFHTGLKFVKLYGPAIIVGTLSVGAILMSHRILNKRNVALAAAYTAVEKGFKEYRGRVVDRFGERVDKELKYGLKSKEVEVVSTDEDGKVKTETKNVDFVDADGNEYSEFARFFDETSTAWVKNAEYNLKFLKDQEAYANHILKSRGYITLNEVYRMLGMNETQAGMVIGWFYDKKNPNHKGDNKVSFDLTNAYKKGVRDFVNGHEYSVLIDFNVDGNIYNRMK